MKEEEKKCIFCGGELWSMYDDDFGEKFWCEGCGSLSPNFRHWCENWPPPEDEWWIPKNKAPVG